MGLGYLWDTNIVIYFLQQQFPPAAEKFIDRTLNNSAPAISVISEIELLCWKTPNEEDQKVLQEFLSKVWVFEIEKEIKLKTAELRKSYKVKLPDAIIAATAQVYDLKLITRNAKDFSEIKNLVVINPFDF